MPPASAARYDIAGDFSTNANPNGVWSYGYATKLGGRLILYTDKSASIARLLVWRHDIAAGAPAIFYNCTSETNTDGTPHIYPHQACFHPGPNNEYSIYRFTAPAGGNYQLQATFAGADANGTTTDVHVLKNDVAIFDGTVNGFGAGTGPVFSTNLLMQANDRIEFEVGDGNNGYQYDSTGIQATLTSSGDSASFPAGHWVLLVIILVVIVVRFIRWRIRCRAPAR